MARAARPRRIARVTDDLLVEIRNALRRTEYADLFTNCLQKLLLGHNGRSESGDLDSAELSQCVRILSLGLLLKGARVRRAIGGVAGLVVVCGLAVALWAQSGQGGP